MYSKANTSNSFYASTQLIQLCILLPKKNKMKHWIKKEGLKDAEIIPDLNDATHAIIHNFDCTIAVWIWQGS